MVEHHDTAKHLGDALSLSVVVTTVLGWLPAVAAFLSIIWTCIRIYETRTVMSIIKWVRGKE